MITEAIFRVFWGFLNLLDSIIPPIPWPDWLRAPADFMVSWAQSDKVNMTGIFMFVHPLQFDVLALALTLRVVGRIVHKTKEAVSIATGGGLNG